LNEQINAETNCRLWRLIKTYAIFPILLILRVLKLRVLLVSNKTFEELKTHVERGRGGGGEIGRN